jgi:hypothetical protein
MLVDLVEHRNKWGNARVALLRFSGGQHQVAQPNVRHINTIFDPPNTKTHHGPSLGFT